jgi:predicted GIY-YIG superfamily endonuclease
MKHYVYKIVNSNNEIEYIGETTNTKNRWYNHIGKNGKFYNRKDISIEIITQFDTKKEAYDYQCELQKNNGFETDLEKMKSRIKEFNILHNSGTTNYLSKLTNEEISEIRKIYIPYHKLYNTHKLAKKYNVSYQTIHNVVTNKHYKY